MSSSGDTLKGKSIVQIAVSFVVISFFILLSLAGMAAFYLFRLSEDPPEVTEIPVAAYITVVALWVVGSFSFLQGLLSRMQQIRDIDPATEESFRVQVAAAIFVLLFHGLPYYVPSDIIPPRLAPLLDPIGLAVIVFVVLFSLSYITISYGLKQKVPRKIFAGLAIVLVAATVSLYLM